MDFQRGKNQSICYALLTTYLLLFEICVKIYKLNIHTPIFLQDRYFHQEALLSAISNSSIYKCGFEVVDQLGKSDVNMVDVQHV